MTTPTSRASSRDFDNFAARHIGPRQAETEAMLELLGYKSLDALIDAAVPKRIRMAKPLAIQAGRSELEALKALGQIASRNELYRSYLGMGYFARSSSATARWVHIAH